MKFCLDTLNDTAKLLALGTLDYSIKLPSPMPQAPDHWMWVPQWPNTQLDHHIEFLLLNGYIRITCKPHKNNLRVRIYAVPIDAISKSIRPRATKESKACFNFLFKHVDTSPEAWNATPERSSISSPEPPKLSLHQLWTSLESPQISILENTDTETRAILDSIIAGDVLGLKTVLYEYQVRSCWKMLQRELCPQRTLDPSLYAHCSPTKDIYFKNDSNEIFASPVFFEDTRGGILAEKMGFGKTLICIAVILATLHQESKIPGHVLKTTPPTHSLVQKCIHSIQSNSLTWRHHSDFAIGAIEYLKTHPAYYYLPKRERRTLRTVAHDAKLFLSHATIVIAPDNLLSHWLDEIHKHTFPGSLKCLVVETQCPGVFDLLQADLVLVSHSRFAMEGRRESSPLLGVHWKRLMVDEGHSMSSKVSDASRLSQNLAVDRRWLISGTITPGLGVDQPDPRSEKDDLAKLGFLISEFLRLNPYHSTSLWSMVVREKSLVLRDTLNRIVVRNRDKDLGVKLPPLNHRTVLLNPSSHNITAYNIFVALVASNAVTSQRTDQDYFFHPSQREHLKRLISNLYAASFWWTGTPVADLVHAIGVTVKAMSNTYTPEDHRLLLKTLETLQAPLYDSVWIEFSTNHQLGYYIDNLPPQLEMSRGIITGERLLQLAVSSDSPPRIIKTCSAKLNYLCEQVWLHSPREKVIIFSEFEDVLYYTAEALKIIGVEHLVYARGNKRKLSQYLSTFNTSEKVRVLLMDLRLASHGIDISSASRIYFTHPVWRRDIEAQAIRRAHRIGQVRPVVVETLILCGTFEEQILKRRSQLEGCVQEKNLQNDKWIRHVIESAQFIDPQMAETKNFSQPIYLRRIKTESDTQSNCIYISNR